ncbi:MAG TPA: hypothetical protein VGZ28_02770 [Terriglobales bacterium]|jgi:hypothetical protein|nr:hypothetical protein [Terriglobales bacterium]
MDADEHVVNQLWNALEGLLIENQAYASAFETLEQFFPAEVCKLLRRHVDAIKAAPEIREVVRNRIARLKGQSPRDIVEGVLKRSLKPKD